MIWTVVPGGFEGESRTFLTEGVENGSVKKESSGFSSPDDSLTEKKERSV
jgi:hypothetical protein